VTGTIPASAQSADLINADRPGLADTAAVIGKWRLQVETGVQWETREDGYDYFIPALFRVGVSERLEARVEGNSLMLLEAAGERESGLTPFSLGLKAVVLPDAGRRPRVGVIGRFFPAWGTGELASQRATGDIRVAADWAVGGPFSLNPNAGIGWYEGADRDFVTALLALTLTYAPRPSLYWFVDAGGQTREEEGGAATITIDAGIGYIPRQNWQLDISAGTRARGETSAQGFVSIGISYRHK
jgi:hypothetical protein